MTEIDHDKLRAEATEWDVSYSPGSRAGAATGWRAVLALLDERDRLEEQIHGDDGLISQVVDLEQERNALRSERDALAAKVERVERLCAGFEHGNRPFGWDYRNIAAQIRAALRGES